MLFPNTDSAIIQPTVSNILLKRVISTTSPTSDIHPLIEDSTKFLPSSTNEIFNNNVEFFDDNNNLFYCNNLLCTMLPNVLIALFLVFLILLTIFGNILVVLSVVVYKRMRTFTNILLTSLATSDLLVGLMVMPLSLIDLLHQHQWPFNAFLCKIWATTDVLLCTASILNLCIISIDRYLAITYPLKYSRTRSKNMAFCLLSAVWGLSFIVCSPPWIIPSWKMTTTASKDKNSCSYPPSIAYRIYSALGSFYIPLLVMLSVYFKIFRVASTREAMMRDGLGTCRLSRRANIENKKERKTSFTKSAHIIRTTTNENMNHKSAKNQSFSFINKEDLKNIEDENCIENKMISNSITLTSNIGNNNNLFEDDKKDMKLSIPSTSFHLKTILLKNTNRFSTGQLMKTELKNGYNHKSSEDYYGFRNNSTNSLQYPIHQKQWNKKNTNAVEFCNKTSTYMYRHRVQREYASLIDLTTKSKPIEEKEETKDETSCIKEPLFQNTLTIDTPSNLTGYDDKEEVKTLVKKAQMTYTKLQPNNLLAKAQNHYNTYGPGRVVRGSKEKMVYLRERKALKTIGIVVMGFIICWMPFFILYLIEVLIDDLHESTAFGILNVFFLWLGYSNSVLNPIIYTMYNGDFRRCFRDLLTFGCVSRQRRTMSVRKLHQQSTTF